MTAVDREEVRFLIARTVDEFPDVTAWAALGALKEALDELPAANS